MSSQGRAKTIKHFQRNQEIHPIILCLLKDTEFSKLGFNSMWTENFQMFKLDLEKGRGNSDQIASIYWIIEEARDFQKNIYFCCIDCTKAFDCVNYNELWKILKEMGIPDRLTCLLRNLYAGQEATMSVRTGHEQWTGSKLEKEYVCLSCILSPCLFNLYASCEMPGWMKHKLESRLPGEI